MDSNQDVDTRIAQLELELAELRAERPRATRVGPEPVLPRRRASSRWWVAASLFALSLPMATWLHAESRGEQANRLQRRALHVEARLDLAERRHEVATKFLDVAMDPRRDHAERKAALRYLANELGEKSKLRHWAKRELAAIEDAAAPSCHKRSKAQRRAEQAAAAANSCGH